MNEIERFIYDYGPCEEAREWLRGFNTLSEAWEKCERSDWLIWALWKISGVEKAAWVRIAIACAARVLKIFEAKYPDDKRPRKAIAAARAWVKNPTDENRREASASSAAAAAYYAYPAFIGASAAASAAAAAADAANAAETKNAGYSATDAAIDALHANACNAYDEYCARKKERAAQCKIIRRIIANPFGGGR